VEFDSGIARPAWIPIVAYREDETPVRAPKLAYAQIMTLSRLYVISYVYIACGCLSYNIRFIELFVSLYLILDRSIDRFKR